LLKGFNWTLGAYPKPRITKDNMSTPPVTQTPRLPASAMVFQMLRKKPRTIDEMATATGLSRQSIDAGLKKLRVKFARRKQPRGMGGQPQKEWALISNEAELLDLCRRADGGEDC
jgi:predicted ArsR family transcriptional regulator